MSSGLKQSMLGLTVIDVANYFYNICSLVKPEIFIKKNYTKNHQVNISFSPDKVSNIHDYLEMIH